MHFTHFKCNCILFRFRCFIWTPAPTVHIGAHVIAVVKTDEESQVLEGLGQAVSTQPERRLIWRAVSQAIFFEAGL